MSVISVIVCSRDPALGEQVRRNALRTAGTGERVRDLEVLILNNAEKPRGICAVYNEGARQSRGDILVFMHEDVFFLEFGWAEVLRRKFASDPQLGILGVAGTQALVADPPLWTWAGQPYLAGKVVHELDGGERFFMTVFSAERGDREVVAVDGLWMAARRRAWENHPFDETTFPGFHFYDLDFCMQVRQMYRIVVTTDILVKHLSPGSFGVAWRAAAENFRNKWEKKLPAVAAGVRLPVVPGESFYNVNLKGRVPQITLE